MDNLRERRRTEVTITNTECRKLLGAKYIFDVFGKLITHVSCITPEWLLEKLRECALVKPHISGTEVVEITSADGETLYASALVERYLDVTLGEILDDMAIRFPNKEAVVDISSNVRMNYEELKEASDHFAKILIDLGATTGDIIAVVMLNCIEQIIAKYAVSKTGAVIVNISPYEKEAGFKTLLERTDATMLILRPGVKAEETIENLYSICPELKTTAPGALHAEALPKLRTVIVSRSETEYPGTLRFGKLLRTEAVCTDLQLEKRLRTITFRDIATIIHTSGTNSVPKSVMLTQGTIIENAYWHQVLLGITSEDRIFTPVPMFHALGCIGSSISALIAGATMICMSKPKVPLSLEVISNERCTVIFAVPSYYIALVEAIMEKGIAATKFCLKLCVMAGSECTERTIRDVNQVLGAQDVLVMYGMTEAGPGITSTRLDDSLNVKTNSVGKPWPGVTIKLINQYSADDGTMRGEICVHGYNVMWGYYKDQQGTSSAIDEDGWLHTGDVGCMREDGNLVICGRTKDIITRNGENISPKEVENVLKSHPFVKEAYVVGARDYKCGEDIYAFVKLNTDATLSESELIAFCRGKLATIKIPEHISFVNDFVKSTTGKILRRELRAIAQELHNKEKGC